MKRSLLALIPAAYIALVSSTTYAIPTDIDTTLTGDIRYTDINDLAVDVNISFGMSQESNVYDVANWIVDLGPMGVDYPGAKLQGFFFNLDAVTNNYAIDVISPVNWGVTYDATPANAHGSGGATFSFEVDKTKGNAADVNTTTDLLFSMRLFDENGDAMEWMDSMFSNAFTEIAAAGTGQLGAHIGGLTDGCSGFVMGNYDGSGNGGDNSNPTQTCSNSTAVPEPGSLALFSLGLISLSFIRRKKSA